MCKVTDNLKKTAVIIMAFCFVLPLYAARFAGGTGEPNDPYQIATAEQLVAIGSDPNLLDKHFVLTADIDLDPDLPGGEVFNRAVIAPALDGADPNSGFQGTTFSGVFDGNHYTISNLMIHGVGHLGLFGLISGAVKNIGVVDAEITGSSNDVGLLAGSSLGAVIECHTDGAVAGDSRVGGLVGQTIAGQVVRCYSDAAVTATGSSVGGLVGFSDAGSVAMGYSTGAVNGHSHVGGLVGYNDYGTIAHSYSLGSVRGSTYIGGLVGRNWSGYVTHCYSIGAVGGESAFGGLVGSNSFSGRPGIVHGCFWDTQTSGQTFSASGVPKETARMQELSTFLAAGWDFVDETANGTSDYWQIAAGEYPRLRCYAGDGRAMPEGSGTAEEPYLIRDATDLGVVWFEPAAHYRLDGPVDLSGITWSVAVVPWFEGDFDGNGHVISNLRVRGAGYLGLFGRCGPAARILNLGLEAVDVNGIGQYLGGLVGDSQGDIDASYSIGMIAGGGLVGGLAGNNEGSISTSYSMGDVTGHIRPGNLVGGLVGQNSGVINFSHSAGAVDGSKLVGGLAGYNSGSVAASHSTAGVAGTVEYTGGLVGYNSGSIAASHSTGTVDGQRDAGGFVGDNSGTIATSYCTGAVTADISVGGLVGDNSGEIATSYCTGAVTGDHHVGGLVGHSADNTFPGFHVVSGITMCYSTGAVSGSDSVGGLAGKCDPSSVTASFWDAEASGQAASAAGTAQTTAEMRTAATFLAAGWDFVDVWTICEGKDYPRLKWEAIDCNQL
ncbi:MAG: GLUG motif-containing protein [Phycisphaerales bacterium]